MGASNWAEFWLASDGNRLQNAKWTLAKVLFFMVRLRLHIGRAFNLMFLRIDTLRLGQLS